jgi:hypothetical protein
MNIQPRSHGNNHGKWNSRNCREFRHQSAVRKFSQKVVQNVGMIRDIISNIRHLISVILYSFESRYVNLLTP